MSYDRFDRGRAEYPEPQSAPLPAGEGAQRRRVVRFIELGKMESGEFEQPRTALIEDAESIIDIEDGYDDREEVDHSHINGDFTHSSSDSYIRYGAHIIDRVPHQHDQVSTSVVLGFCRTRVLRYYLALLAAVGWKPLIDDTTAYCSDLWNFLYATLMVLVILMGHVLQVESFYRRDGMVSMRCKQFSLISSNPASEGCTLNMFAVYLLPAMLHFASYVVMFVQMRSQDSEEFTALVEKVFLQTTSVWQIARRKIHERLRTVYVLGVLWILGALVSNVLNIVEKINSSNSHFECTYNNVTFVVFLVLGLLMHDFVSMSIAVAYTIHCQLALVFLQNLQQLLRDGKISLLAFYKGICEATTTIDQVNGMQATAVFLQTIWLLIRTASSMVSFVQAIDSEDYWRLAVSTVSVLVWGSLTVVPLGQAARLSTVCHSIQNLGRELRARPLVYQETAPLELDSFLLFSSTFDLRAQLCSIEITRQRLFVCLLAFILLFYGAAQFDQLHF